MEYFENMSSKRQSPKNDAGAKSRGSKTRRRESAEMPTIVKKKRDRTRDIARQNGRRMELRGQTPPPELLPLTVTGRPTLYTRELADKICFGIASGKTATSTCRLHGVEPSSFFAWCYNNTDGLYARYTSAREIGAEVKVDQAEDMIDAPLESDYSDFGASAELQHRKLRMESIKWFASKNHYRRFGDKVTSVVEGGEKPVRTITSNMTAEEAQAAYIASLRDDD